MAIRSQPYQLSWEEKAKTLEDVNRKLSQQLLKANEMFHILFQTINNLTARIEALE